MVTQEIKVTDDLLERFWANVNISSGSSNPCFIWTGSIDSNGYGAISHQGKRYGAHRLSYLIHNGGIREGLLACHKCDVPPCVNPAHIYAGTHEDNMNDAWRARMKREAKQPKWYECDEIVQSPTLPFVDTTHGTGVMSHRVEFETVRSAHDGSVILRRSVKTLCNQHYFRPELASVPSKPVCWKCEEIVQRRGLVPSAQIAPGCEVAERGPKRAKKKPQPITVEVSPRELEIIETLRSNRKLRGLLQGD